MRKVVSNTTPLLSLLKLGRLHLLKDLYGNVIVPYAVYLEIERGRDWEYYVDLSKQSWITIQKLANPEALSYFFDLDSGEAEVIVLARELHADLVILDESLGRRYAQELGLTLTGTIGVLLKAKQNRLIPSVKNALLELSEKGVWLSTALIQHASELAGE
ncbi:DUF3368 domain-containing protein [Olivibacter sitiensis]|uniref:DUF3368 domain-containing protein n=1 Tax=Olivibacter sitiensis TaxID=376470 RepID=UPI0003FCF555|nr:DUF3368 domain-containing protein [Olivibacter sitiensis]